MITDDKNYETYILKQVINNYLDKILSVNDEDALNTLLYQCDDLVWKIATAIYSQSGVYLRAILPLKIIDRAR